MFCQAKADKDNQQGIQNGLLAADLVRNFGHLKSEQ